MEEIALITWLFDFRCSAKV